MINKKNIIAKEKPVADAENKTIFQFFKKYWMVPALLLAGLFIAFIIYATFITPLTENTFIAQNFAPDVEDNHFEVLIENGQEIEQQFSQTGYVSGFDLVIGGYNSVLYKIELEGNIFDAVTDEHLGYFWLQCPTLDGYMQIYSEFPQDVKAESGEYKLVFHFNGIEKNQKLSLWLTNNEEYAANSIIEGVNQNGMVHMRTYTRDTFLHSYFWFLASIIIISLPLLWLLLFRLKAKPQQIFAVAAFVFGIAYMFVQLPYTTADAKLHARMSFYWSNEFKGGESQQEGAFISWDNRAEDSMKGFSNVSDDGIFTIFFSNRKEYRYVWNNFLKTEESPGETIRIETEKTGYAYQYLPQTLGVMLGQFLGLGQVPTLYLGQLFSLLVYIAVLYAAIKITPFKTLFCLLGLVPLILQNAASFSYDTSINALSFIYLAVVFKIAYGSEKTRVKDIVILLISGVLLLPLKTIYFPILFAALIIPLNKWANKAPKGTVKTKAAQRKKLLLIALPIIFIFAVIAIFIAVNFDDIMFHLGGFTKESGFTLWLEQTYTYNIIIANTREFLRLFIATAVDRFDNILTAGGAILHQDLPVWTSIIMFFLFVSSVSSVENGQQLQVKKKPKGSNDFYNSCNLFHDVSGVFKLDSGGQLLH